MITFAGIGSAYAQPTDVINFILGVPAGGQADAIARSIQPVLQNELGKTVIVDNVPGAGTAIGTQKLLSAGPNGRNFMLLTMDEATLTPLSVAAAKYKSDDLRVVAVLSRSDYALVARPTFNLDVNQLVRSKDEFSNAILGPASIYRLAMEDFKKKSGVKTTMVPYKGFAPMTTDLIGGFVDIAFVPVAGSVPAMISEGKFKLLASATANRFPFSPSTPTLTEVLKTKFEYSVAPGIYVHRDTPEAFVVKLHATLEKIKASPEFKKFTEATGSTVMPQMSLAETEAFYRAEASRFKALAEAADVKPQ